jgi:small-conductance mechanosensitive channel
MINNRPQLKFWLVGLAMFGGLIALNLIRGGASEYTILDHQAAGSAAMVDTIQADWRVNGLRQLAIFSMIGDLIFIGFYGCGAFIAGRSFSRIGGGLLRALGVIIAGAAVIFLIADYVETILQLIQLLREQGSDWMSGTAATVRPIKVATWIITFAGILAALAFWRFSARDA